MFGDKMHASQPHAAAAVHAGTNGTEARSALPMRQELAAGGGAVAPRTGEELQRHMDNIPETVQALNRETPPGNHSFVTGMTTSATCAALQEAFRVLALPEHLAVLTNIVHTQLGIAAKQAATHEGLEASRLTARAAFVGSYDAVEQKWQEALKALPQYTYPACAAGAAFLAAFLLGAFLALWRFVLFGLR